MCVDESHLVLESFGDTDDQVVDERADGSESSDILSRTVVQFDVDYILLGLGEVDGQMIEVLCELAYSSVNTVSVYLPFDLFHTSGTLNCDQSRLDVDLDYSRQPVSNCSSSNCISIHKLKLR